MVTLLSYGNSDVFCDSVQAGNVLCNEGSERVEKITAMLRLWGLDSP